jgi:hypothetical protein
MALNRFALRFSWRAMAKRLLSVLSSYQARSRPLLLRARNSHTSIVVGSRGLLALYLVALVALALVVAPVEASKTHSDRHPSTVFISQLGPTLTAGAVAVAAPSRTVSFSHRYTPIPISSTTSLNHLDAHHSRRHQPFPSSSASAEIHEDDNLPDRYQPGSDGYWHKVDMTFPAACYVSIVSSRLIPFRPLRLLSISISFIYQLLMALLSRNTALSAQTPPKMPSPLLPPTTLSQTQAASGSMSPVQKCPLAGPWGRKVTITPRSLSPPSRYLSP